MQAKNLLSKGFLFVGILIILMNITACSSANTVDYQVPSAESIVSTVSSTTVLLSTTTTLSVIFNGDESDDHVVVIDEDQFFPDEVRAYVGDTVIWENQDDSNHNLLGFGVDIDLRPGEDFSYTFDDAGRYSYSCDIHSGMRGTIIVRDKDGS